MALEFEKQEAHVKGPDIHDAVSRLDRVALEAYLRGGDVNIVSADALQDTLLHICIKHYGIQIWNPIPDMLLSAGARINTQNAQGDTPLHYAVAFASPSMAKWCLLHGADCWIRNNDGALPVEASIRLASREDSVEGVAQSVAETVQAWTALKDDPAERRRLIKEWEEEISNDRNVVYSDMFAIAEKAIGEHSLPSLRMCVEFKGIDVNFVLSPGKIGRTMLMTAARVGDLKSVTYLLSRGADPRAADARGGTPLHYAAHKDARSEHVACVRALLDAGADPLARDFTPARATPLELLGQLQTRGPREVSDLENVLSNAVKGKTTKSARQRSPERRTGEPSSPMSPRRTAVIRLGDDEPAEDYRLEQTAIEHMNDTISLTELKSTLKVGDIVDYSGFPAVVKYVGRVHFAAGPWVGIAVEKQIGKNNGVVDGKRYFIAADRHGLFVRPAAVTKLNIEHVSHMRSY